MATKAQARKTGSRTRTASAKAPTEKKTAKKRAPREPIEMPKEATFDTNDKRAQYARLVVFNFAKSTASKAKPAKGADVNSVSEAVLTQAGLELAGGNMLRGPDGLDLIMSLTKDGSTTGRPLTKAYAAEVRPFLRRLKLSSGFGRRSGGGKKAAPVVEETQAEGEAVQEEAA